jgi:thiosulfate/3-mercaptopyruvate sulfurtransferase
MWWMLRVFGHDKVSVLNGGFQKWSREGRAIAVGQSKPRVASSFEPAFRAELVANKADVFAAINDQRICTINALRPEQHRGEPGGSNYGRPGHIAGSVNIAAIHIVDENNVFKPLHELRIMFSKALASDRVITYCGGGIAASSDALILTMLGHQDVRIYDASLSEWARDESLPMETA